MLSDSMAFYLQRNNYIEKDDLPIYKYAFAALLNSIFQVIIISILGIFFGVIEETIAFLVVFISTRRYLGGYHANTKLRCLVLSLITWSIATSSDFLFIYFNKKAVVILLLIFSLYVTYKYAPIENYHKPLNEYQKRQNGIKGILLMCIFFSIALALVDTRKGMSQTIAITLLLVDIFILVGRRENVKRQRMQGIEENC